MPLNDYVTLAEFKAALPDGSGGSSQWGSAYDSLLNSLIKRASRKFDDATSRDWGAYAATDSQQRFYDAPGITASSAQGFYDNRLGGGMYGSGHHTRLWIDEITAAPTDVSVTMDGNLANFTALATTDYILGPYNALAKGYPYEWIELDVLYGKHSTWYGFRKGVRVTAVWGYSGVALDPVKQGIIDQVAHWLQRGRDQYQDEAVILDPGQKVYHVYTSDFNELADMYRRQEV